MVSLPADTRTGANRRTVQRENGWKRMAMTRAKFTIVKYKEKGNLRMESWKGLRARFGFGNGFVAGTREDGKAGVFGISGIRGGALAEEELRAFSGFDRAGVKAVRAEAS